MPAPTLKDRDYEAKTVVVLEADKPVLAGIALRT